jgi:hypothetical protein
VLDAWLELGDVAAAVVEVVGAVEVGALEVEEVMLDVGDVDETEVPLDESDITATIPGMSEFAAKTSPVPES